MAQIRGAAGVMWAHTGSPQQHHSNGNGEHRQRRADLEVIPKAYVYFVARLLHHDEVGDRADNGQIARQRGGHSQRQPHSPGVAQAGDEGLKDQHCGHVAHDVGKQRRKRAQHGGALQVEAFGEAEEIVGQSSRLHAGHHDKQSDEEHQQRPVDFVVDFFRFDAARNQQQRARHQSHFWNRPAGEEESDHPRRHGERLPHQRPVGAHRARFKRDFLPLAELPMVDGGDERHGQHQPGQGNGRERRGERRGSECPKNCRSSCSAGYP